jgi:hypothetical protein
MHPYRTIGKTVAENRHDGEDWNSNREEDPMKAHRCWIFPEGFRIKRMDN